MIAATLAVSPAGNFEAGPAIGAGLVGAVAMLAVIYMGLASGMTSMNLLKTLGTMVSPKGPDNVVYGIGLMMHLMMGAVFGLVHSGLLHAVDPSSAGAAAGFGALFGGIHGMAVAAVMMPVMLTKMHPLVKSGDMPAPGVAMTGMGTMTPMGITMAHVVFGLVTGAIYVAIVG